MILLSDLPEKIYPQVEIDNGLGYQTPNGVLYGNSHISCVREFCIYDGCVYKEYYESYSGNSFYLVNVEFLYSITTDKSVNANVLLTAYPDMVNPNDLFDTKRFADFKRIMYEDLNKPLLRKDIKIDVDSTYIPEVRETVSIKNDYGFEDLLKEFKELSNRVEKLEQDNLELKKQLMDLANGQVPKDFSSVILENLFEDKQS